MAALTAQSQISISDGGAPSYSHPISVPPGIAGMAPNISLVYNAGGVNGVVGYGWTVQGISAITRCGSTRAIDGKVRAVDYTSDDKLCLDGQRLIQTDAKGVAFSSYSQTSDSLGGSGLVHEYRTEKDSYARIRAYGMANGLAANGPAYFKVWTKSGQIYEYGNYSNNSANSAIAVPGKAVISAWAVSRISDTLGNYIEFQYEQRDPLWGSHPAGGPTPGHEWNLTEIRYTGTPSLPPANKVVFDLQDRTNTPGARQDTSEGYRGGAKNVSIRRLNAIRTYINTQPSATPVKVKTVKLAYDNGPITNRSLLKTITECVGAAETACLPATTFNYQSGGSEAYVPRPNFNLSVSPSGTPDLLASNSGVLPGDFNGDGKTDLLIWSDTPANNQLWFSNGDGSFAKSAGFNITDQNLSRGDGCYFTILTDINGDGLPDLYRFASSYNKSGKPRCPTKQYVPPLVYLNKGDGSFTQKPYDGPMLEMYASGDSQFCGGTECSTRNPPTAMKISAGQAFYLMDVDNDGIQDIVISVLPEFTITYSASPSLPPDPCLARICTFVYKGVGNGNFYSIPTNMAHISLQPANAGGASAAIIDIDGDGLTDLAGVGVKYYRPVGAYRSRGDGNFDPIAWVGPCGVELDFNGDGRRDCVVAWGAVPELRATTGTAGADMKVDNFNLTTVEAGETRSGFSGGVDWPLSGVSSLDINGDGRQDILRWKKDPTQNAVYLSNGDGTFTASKTFNLNTATRPLKMAEEGAVSVGGGFNIDFVVGDFTGRGNTEFLRLRKSPVAGNEALSNQLYVKEDPSQPDLLSSVVSPTGMATRLTWVPLRNSASGSLGLRYKSDRDTPDQATFPNMDITPPMYVVATTVSDSGVGAGTVATEYFYAGLKASHDGRGLQGLRETRRQSDGPNGESLTVVRQYLQGFPYSGVLRQSETWKGPLNSGPPQVSTPPQLLGRTTYTYCDTASPGGPSATPKAPCVSSSLVQRSYVYKKVDESWDLNGAVLPTVTTLNSYTGSGDPISIAVSTNFTASGQTQASVKTTHNLYFADNTAGDNWILGRLQRSMQSNSAPSFSNSGIQIMAGAQAALSDLALGNVPLSLNGIPSTTSANVTLINSGSVSLALVAPTASSVIGVGFSFASTTCSGSLAPGASCVTGIKFSPTALGTSTGSLAVVTSAGILTSALSGTGVAGGQATLPDLAFGNVPLTVNGMPSTVTSPVVLTNSGTVSLTLGVPTASSVRGTGFSFSSSSCSATLAPGSSCWIYVKFLPSALGTSTGSLTIVSNAGSLTAALSAVVVAPPPPPAGPGTFSLVSGSISGPVASVKFTNTGTGIITGITASCQNGGFGSVTLYGPSTTSLAPGAQIDIVAISSSSPNPNPAGYCKAIIRGTNATNSPYVSSTY